MPKFAKKILRAGSYEIPDPNGPNELLPGHKSRTETIDAGRLRRWAKTHAEMVGAGHRIPAPWKHRKDAVPVAMGEEGILTDSTVNAGFWERLWVDNDADGVPSLFGEIDTPGDVNDPATPAGKIGKTVQETSINTDPDYQVYSQGAFADGKASVWKDPILHIACCTHAVEPGQENFQPTNTPHALALSMAMQTSAFVGEDGTETIETQSGFGTIGIDTLIEELEDIAGICLAEDTSEQSLIERLHAALLQKKKSEEDKDTGTGTTKKPPKDAEESTAPFIMSFTQKQQDDILKLAREGKLPNPETGNPYSEDEMTKALAMSSPPKKDEPASPPAAIDENKDQADRTNTILMSHLTDNRKGELRHRIATLKARGVDSKYIDETVAPQVESLSMSFGAKGEIIKSPVESLIEGLEAASPSSKPSPLSLGGNVDGEVSDYMNRLAMSMMGASELPNPNDMAATGVQTQEQIEAASDALLASMT